MPGIISKSFHELPRNPKIFDEAKDADIETKLQPWIAQQTEGLLKSLSRIEREDTIANKRKLIEVIRTALLNAVKFSLKALKIDRPEEFGKFLDQTRTSADPKATMGDDILEILSTIQKAVAFMSDKLAVDFTKKEDVATLCRLIGRLPVKSGAHMADVIKDRHQNNLSLLSINSEDAAEFVSNFPDVIIIEPKNLDEKIEAIAQMADCTRSEVASLYKRCPALINISVATLEKNLNLLTDAMKTDGTAIEEARKKALKKLFERPDIWKAPSNFIRDSFYERRQRLMEELPNDAGALEKILGILLRDTKQTEKLRDRYLDTNKYKDGYFFHPSPDPGLRIHIKELIIHLLNRQTNLAGPRGSVNPEEIKFSIDDLRDTLFYLQKEKYEKLKGR